MSEKFESFAIVELMGRSVIAGMVTEQVIGGSAFVRVDVPESNGVPAFTKFFGASAIYCLTPCDEATAKAAIEGLRVKPINVYMLNLPSRVSDFDEGDDDEN